MPEIPKVKKWCNIDPTLIGSDYNRFEIINNDNPDALVVFVKMPDTTMNLSCDRCAGPHRKHNFMCSLNNGNTEYLPSPTNGSIYLFDLYTHERIPGNFLLEFQTTNRRKSAIAVLWREHTINL